MRDTGIIIARRGGRPSRDEAGKIRDQILDAATGLFFSQGYGSTSVEAIAERAGISKRTFYARFKDKADVFQAVVQRVIERLQQPHSSNTYEGGCEEVLQRVAVSMLRATLMPESLALNRLILSEAERFPELALLAHAQGARQRAVDRIASVLRHEVKNCRFSIDDTTFAAEQFIQMVTSLPLRRALTLGQKMTASDIEAWAHQTVVLFVNGCSRR